MKISITTDRYVPYINERVADTKTQNNMNINTAAKLTHQILSSATFNTKVQCLYIEVLLVLLRRLPLLEPMESPFYMLFSMKRQLLSMTHGQTKKVDLPNGLPLQSFFRQHPMTFYVT